MGHEAGRLYFTPPDCPCWRNPLLQVSRTLGRADTGHSLVSKQKAHRLRCFDTMLHLISSRSAQASFKLKRRIHFLEGCKSFSPSSLSKLALMCSRPLNACSVGCALVHCTCPPPFPPPPPPPGAAHHPLPPRWAQGQHCLFWSRGQGRSAATPNLYPFRKVHTGRYIHSQASSCIGCWLAHL